MEEDGGEASTRRVQVRLVTKLDAPYKVPTAAIAIPADLTRLGLSSIVNALLQNKDADHKPEPFDFLIDGEFVHMSLEQFLLAKGISAVTEDQIQRDLWMNKFDWDHPIHLQPTSPTTEKNVNVVWDAYEATKDADGVCVLTEWDEFKSLDYQRIYDNMRKPAFLFDGRNVVDADKLREIGKPLDAWLKDMPAVA